MASRNEHPAYRGRAGDGSLRGWKEIAAFLGVDERTVKRWEQSRGLPVRRVPGEARAPVFVFPDELTAWLASRDGLPAAPVAPPPEASGRPRPRLLAVLALLVVVMAGFLAWQLQRPVASPDDALRLGAIAAMADRLERTPGTLRMRAALAGEAATQLARVAAQTDASPALKREAAMAYLRLANVQDNVNRPSLRDAAAADASLAQAARLVAGDGSAAGRVLAGRVLMAQAMHHAGARRLTQAAAALKQAEPLLASADARTRTDLVLAQAELALWQGRYAAAERLAQTQMRALSGLAQADWLRQLRARDLAAESAYYQGQMATAAGLYGESLAGAETAARHWPGEQGFAWAVHRQHWNLGTTLLEAGNPTSALPHLRAARDSWLALAAADPDDPALAWWRRVTRQAYGEGLMATGRVSEGVAELSASVAERRTALAAAPSSVERQDSLVTGLGALGTALARNGRVAEGCALLTEASQLVVKMASAGQIAPNDHDRIVAAQRAVQLKWCRAPG